MTTVVLADEQPVVRDGLRGLFAATTGITVLAEAATGRDAAEAVHRHRPDVLVLDLALGADVARQASAETSVLVFTALEDDASIVSALRAGARGYLLKRADPADVLRGVRGVALGTAVFGAGIGGRITGLLSRPPLPELSEREREILALTEAGLPTPQIARQLGLAPKTVRNRLSVINAKLRIAC